MSGVREWNEESDPEPVPVVEWEDFYHGEEDKVKKLFEEWDSITEVIVQPKNRLRNLEIRRVEALENISESLQELNRRMAIKWRIE